MQILIIYLHSNHSRRINRRLYIFFLTGFLRKYLKKQFSKEKFIYFFQSEMYFSFLKFWLGLNATHLTTTKKSKIIEKY